MARYKDYSYTQGKFIPIFFERQILPGTFEYSLNHLMFAIYGCKLPSNASKEWSGTRADLERKPAQLH